MDEFEENLHLKKQKSSFAPEIKNIKKQAPYIEVILSNNLINYNRDKLR